MRQSFPILTFPVRSECETKVRAPTVTFPLRTELSTALSPWTDTLGWGGNENSHRKNGLCIKKINSLVPMGKVRYVDYMLFPTQPRILGSCHYIFTLDSW